MSLRFELSLIEHNQSGWGPSSLPQGLQESIYAPFSKGDRLGRIAEVSAQPMPSSRAERIYATGVVNQNFNLFQQDDTFQLVENTKAKPSPFSRPNRQPFKGPKPNFNTPRTFQKLGNIKQTKFNSNKPRGPYRRYQNWGATNKLREPSIVVQPTWEVKQEIEFVRLAKVTIPPPAVSDIQFCGGLHLYERAFDRLTPKGEKVFPEGKQLSPKLNTSSDPILKKLAESGKGNVFGTDAVIAIIMASTRSHYPWDLILTRTGDKLFFDKRDSSHTDLETVNESATEPPSDTEGINSPDALALEATLASAGFSNFVLNKTDKIKFENASPFPDQVPAKGYRYRQFKLDDKVTLILRTELDAYFKGPNGNAYLTLKSLLEYDPKVGSSWRAKLDSQRGATLATELKNNSTKLTRWTAEALLSGADHIKMGFVSRTNPKDANKHSLLATQALKPADFATQINFNVSNAWGIVKTIIDTCLDLPEGKYRLVKDPNKTVMRIYNVPLDDPDAPPVPGELEQQEEVAEEPLVEEQADE